ncbi:two-component regulator propeller domain-containing protein [Puia sp. P3]|uniref:two-component regulator propeller domain-containing protein n=1 Tax=Puia sp. P3 TaxID=3423952 RepID=UPI003D6644C4
MSWTPRSGRLDRLNLHRYAADRSRSFSLLNIYADHEGRIWVATDYGLFRYLPATNSFRQYLHREGDSSSLRDNGVRVICEDKSGDLWIGTEKGLCRLPAGKIVLSLSGRSRRRGVCREGDDQRHQCRQ